jgi:4'-phosphopantetheinyl transferase
MERRGAYREGVNDMQSLVESVEVQVHGPSDDPMKGKCGAHVWLCDLDDARTYEVSGATELLPEEYARAQRIRNLIERRRFIVRSIFVRDVLGKLLGVAPGSLEFATGPRGKPRLLRPYGGRSWPASGFGFNISHSENVLALGVAAGWQVGIDIEVVHPLLDMLTIVDTQFGPLEFERLAALPAPDRTLEFYRLWTEREAAAKLEGNGIALEPLRGTPVYSHRTIHPLTLTFAGKEVVGNMALGREPRADKRPFPLSRGISARRLFRALVE